MVASQPDRVVRVRKESMSVHVSSDKVFKVITGLLILNGCAADIAEDVSEHMLEAERHGYISHGVALLPKYLENIDKGDVTPNARPELRISEGHLLQYDAHNGFGQHAVKVAVNAAMVRARQKGFCLLTVCHAHHLGAVVIRLRPTGMRSGSALRLQTSSFFWRILWQCLAIASDEGRRFLPNALPDKAPCRGLVAPYDSVWKV